MMPSTTSASKSKPDRTAKAIASSPKAARLRAKAAGVNPPARAAGAVPAAEPVAPARRGIALVPLRDLRRAPENVRHIRSDEDILPLADDIEAHGLLQNLIGYEHPLSDHTVMIVGGGRRLQALQELLNRFSIDLDFDVPVLIREKDEAIELSLSENLAKRDMSPVDECHAFKALMDRGNTSPLELAKKFGFGEGYVKQRLKLAGLVPEILDALAEKKITIPSAIAYTATSDPDLQRQVFTHQSKSSFDQHSPTRVAADFKAAQATTASVVFSFVTAEAYEAAGGTYEEDLLSELESAKSGRRLADGAILMSTARAIAEAALPTLVETLRAEVPGLERIILAPNLRSESYPWPAPPTPKGYESLTSGWDSKTNDYHNVTTMWTKAAAANAKVIAIAGLDNNAKLVVRRASFFCEKEALAEVRPMKKTSPAVPAPTAEEREARLRREEIDEIAWRLGIGKFAGTQWEGRAFWPTHHSPAVAVAQMPGGKMVTVKIFVTDEEHEAQLGEAGRQYDEKKAAEREEAQQRAERIDAHAERVAEVLAMSPPPAVIAIDGDAYARDGYGNYLNGLDDEELDGILGAEETYSLVSALDSATPGDLIETFDSIEAFRAKVAEGAPA